VTTSVYLVRHGQTDSNVTGFYMGCSDEDINEVGYEQARRLSLRLADLPLTAVNTSPLRRAVTTATILAESHRLEPQVLDDLIEIKIGDWQGLHRDEIKRRWPDLWRQLLTDPSELIFPGGESLSEVNERAVRAFQRVVATNQGGQALIVTHEIVVKAMVAHILGISKSAYRCFEIGNVSLTAVRVSNHGTRLTVVNDTSHWQVRV